jgi:signal transduction histidine kinase
MDPNPKRRPRHSTIELWRVGVLIAGALFFGFFAFGRAPSREIHEAVLLSLRAVDIDHASLQRDVLRARAGTLVTYKTLDEAVMSLNQTLDDLGQQISASGFESATPLLAQLNKLSSSVAREETLVEQFKIANTALRDAMTAANRMLTRIHDPSSAQKVTVSEDFGNLLMRYATQPSSDLATQITELTDQVVRLSSAENPDMEVFSAATKQFVDGLPKLNALVEELQTPVTSNDAFQLQRKYLDAYGEFNARSSSSRILLGSIAVLLCGYVGLLIYRLRLQTHRLGQQLDFDNVVADVERQFDVHPDSLSVAVNNSLAMFGYFFDAQRSVFMILDRETGKYETTLGDDDLPGLDQFKQNFAKRVLSGDVDLLRGDQPYLYENLQQGFQAQLSGGSLSAGSMIAASLVHGQVGILLLEHFEARKRPDHGEIRLLGQAALALSDQISEFHEKHDRETLEARLDHAQRLEALGTLAGGIAHEFNNALGAILGYGEMALQLGRHSTKTRPYIEEMVSSGHRAKFIIDQILTFSRKRDRVSKPFDVQEAVTEILPMIRMSLAGGFAVNLDTGSGSSVILGNPVELQQVLMNLCKNAAHASGDDGDISVSIRSDKVQERVSLSHGDLQPGDYVVVTVADSGCGIASTSLPHIFEPFFTTKAQRGGTGLGLAAVHGHVTAMNGKINIESEVGVGTDFQIFFPSSAKKPIPLVEFYDEEKVPPGEGQTVVVGQRDDSLRFLFEEKIAALGYEPIGFSSTASIDRWIGLNRRPDVIILDLDLWSTPPNLAEVANTYRPVPTVFVGERQILTSLRLAKVVPVLKKPVNSLNLASILSSQVGIRASGEAPSVTDAS